MQPGKLEEVLQVIRDVVLPAARQAPGFKGLLMLTDPGTNQGIAIAFWESEADLHASEAPGGYYREELAKGAHFFSAPPVQEVYAVSLQV
jgi:hypothetical protein